MRPVAPIRGTRGTRVHGERGTRATNVNVAAISIGARGFVFTLPTSRVDKSVLGLPALSLNLAVGQEPDENLIAPRLQRWRDLSPTENRHDLFVGARSIEKVNLVGADLRVQFGERKFYDFPLWSRNQPFAVVVTCIVVRSTSIFDRPFLGEMDSISTIAFAEVDRFRPVLEKPAEVGVLTLGRDSDVGARARDENPVAEL